MLISVLIPTRGRPGGLTRAIESIACNAPSHAEFEFLVRIDDDDVVMADWLPPLDAEVIIETGPRLDGWKSCHVFYTELCNIARGEFVWIMNDDCVVHGPWFDRLVEAPKRAFIQPENYGLNESLYKECPDVGFPIIPRNAWLEYDYVGKPLMPNPIDSQTYDLLVRKNGWNVHFLPGVTVHHDRKVDATLGKERL